MLRICSIALGLLLALAACDVAEDTTDVSKGGAKNAAGIADKMSQGTAGTVDMESGETADEEDAVDSGG